MSAPLFVAFALALGSVAEASEAHWKLVGTYDTSTLIGLEVTEEEPLSYLWEPAPGMVESCGPAKAPDGLGVFEAEIIANAMAPTLAVVLERASPDAQPMTPEGVRVAIGVNDYRFLLQPMVEPRFISTRITGPGAIRYKQLVRTQLQMELCMEHKTGRGWIGGNSMKLRQAFLLDPPDMDGADRRFFGGQRDPVPALMGPPDACLQKEEGLDTARSVGGQGQGSLDLIPSDVWGSSLRWCDSVESGGATVARSVSSLPLKLSEMEEPSQLTRNWAWSELVVEVGQARTEKGVKIDLTWTERRPGEFVTVEIMKDESLFSMPETKPGEPPPDPGLVDILSRIPYYYPTLGPQGEPGRYVVLLIPNWQIVEGLRRFEKLKQRPDAADELKIPMSTGGRGVMDGVGWVLEHPEFLFVQVPRQNEQIGDVTDAVHHIQQEDGSSPDWLNLTDPVAGILHVSWFNQPIPILEWGFTVGMLAGRQPIVLPRPEQPSWEQVVVAHRAQQHSLFLGCVTLLSVMMLIGVRRLPDLWSDVPEERVDYWPGKAVAPETSDEQPAAPS